MKTDQPVALLLADDGTFPNSSYPVLLYKSVVETAATAFESLFHENGWSGSWRNGVYAYHHYHSVAHEVLGVYSGGATVLLGGEGGEAVEVSAGDVVVIPAGVAHKLLSSHDGFGVVGAYAGGQKPDTMYGNPDERPDADKRIMAIPLPAMDPLSGAEGALTKLWSR